MSRIRNVYTAESSLRNPRQVIRDMVSGMVRSKYMAYRLSIKDIRAEYANSAFGMLWDFVDPLVLGFVFYFLMKVRIINTGELGMPYAVFVVYGLLIYQTFTESLNLSLDAVRRSRNLLTHQKLPPEAIILSVLFRVLFNSLFRVAAMLFFSLMLFSSAANEGTSSFSAVGFPIFLVCYPSIILAGMSIGLFLAPFNVMYRDIGRIVRITLLPLRYATPVLYAIPSEFPFNLIHSLNPISPILATLRALATGNDVVHFGGFVGWNLGFLALFLVAWPIFHLAIPVLVERT